VPTWPQNSSFLQKIVPAVVEEMGLDYVELKARQGAVEKAIADEELRFHATLKNGFSKFQAFVEEEKAKGNLFLSGEKIFILHDSFGFPADLTKMLCEEIGFQACVEDFEKEMQQQKDRSRAEGKFYKFEHAPAGANWVTFREENLEEDRNFAGGSFFEATGTNENQVEIVEVPLPVDHIKKVRQLKNKLFELVIANTPFYPEGGGQVSDTGWIELWHGERCHQFEVIDVQRTPNAIVHVLRDTSAVVLTLEQWKHFLENSSKIVAVLHFSNRLAMMRHHTATHLMHRALQIVLGDHVRQAGSLVNAKALRFDFTHQKALSAQELKEIECFVNAEILKNSPLKIHENISLKSAKDLGAIALFDEKYEDKVRMVEVLGFSKELCGGTHVPRTGHLGLFKIIFEGSVTSGIRRLEAVTGKAVLAHVQKLDNLLETSSHLFKCAPHEIPQKISALQKHTKDLENQLIKAQSKWVNEQVVRMCAESQRLPHHIQLVLSSLENTSLQEAELLCDRLKEKNNIIAVIFLRFSQGLAQLLVAISPELIKQFKNLSAHLIVKELSCVVGAKGGGKAEFAKAGGVQPAQIPMAFEAVSKIITQMIF
jgi:alanyl-tRNA synthetase